MAKKGNYLAKLAVLKGLAVPVKFSAAQVLAVLAELAEIPQQGTRVHGDSTGSAENSGTCAEASAVPLGCL